MALKDHRRHTEIKPKSPHSREKKKKRKHAMDQNIARMPKHINATLF